MANDGREARAARSGYTHSIAGCLSAAIGEHGISEAELKVWLDRLAPAVEALKDDYRNRRLPLLRDRRGDRGPCRRGGRARQAVAGRQRHRLLRHRRLEPRRPDAGPARGLEHPRHGGRGPEEAPPHALLRQPRPRHAAGDARLVRPRQRPLHRHLQVGRHARDAGAGAGRDCRGQGGRPRGADSQAVPRHHRAQGRGQDRTD